eukprot:4054204-Prymnesium_polylepis.2
MARGGNAGGDAGAVCPGGGRGGAGGRAGGAGGAGGDGGDGGGSGCSVKLVAKPSGFESDDVQDEGSAIIARSWLGLPAVAPAYAQLSAYVHDSAFAPSVNPGGSAE